MLINNLTIAQQNSTFFDENFNDYQESLAEAAEQNKSAIFAFFYLDDCPFCHKMRQTVFNQQQVIDFYRQHFINYEIDANGALEIIDFEGNTTTEREFSSKKYNVFATPVMIFFDLTGKIVAYRTGFLNEQDFLLLGKFVKDNQYKNTNFTRYKRQHNQ